jgi:hypothetical protein
MAVDPKPITVTVIAEEDYDAPQKPQPFVIVGDFPTAAQFADLEARVAALETP